MHLNEELLAALDNSAELARAQTTMNQANTDLEKVTSETERTAKRLEKATAILGQFEKLIGWVKQN